MTSYLVSPAERPPISNLGPNSPLVEKVGCDVIWDSKHGLAGCQRKEVADLIASVRPSAGQEPRLGKELEQMKSAHLSFAAVVIEGTPTWDREGNLMSQHTQWTMKNHNGVLLSIQRAGVSVLTSRNALETCSIIEHLAEWSNKDNQTSTLLGRAAPYKNGWGRFDDKAFAISVMTSLPDINTVLATRLWEHFGRCILGLTVTEDELMQVHGIGKKTAGSIVKACKQ